MWTTRNVHKRGLGQEPPENRSSVGFSFESRSPRKLRAEFDDQVSNYHHSFPSHGIKKEKPDWQRAPADYGPRPEHTKLKM